MAIRCLLFSADAGTASPVLQVLASLGVEGEHCSDAVATVEKVTHQNFQIVIIDWDKQPEAGLLLTAARERKAVERPLTLAIVSDDPSVPEVLQAGANSILRKPIIVSQVKDTLTTARDLLRSKQETAAHAAAAGASAGSAPPTTPTAQAAKEKALRAGEFLVSGGTIPVGQFETDSDVRESLEPITVEAIDPLKDLEPPAAQVASEPEEKPATVAAPDPAAPSESRGLQWYLKSRGAATLAPTPARASAPASPVASDAPAAPARPTGPDLLGFELPYSPTAPPAPIKPQAPLAERKTAERKTDDFATRDTRHENTREAVLFSYIDGQKSEEAEVPQRSFPLKRAIIGALVLAACAIVIAPQAPWHPQLRAFWTRERQSLHVWLNPQPVTTPQAPATHESFTRAGDEYKLPVAEAIPDATTDPSQIQVLPVVDPTIKKPNSLGGNALQIPAQGDAAPTSPADQATPSSTQPPDNQSPPSTPETTQPTASAANTPPTSVPTATSPAVSTPQRPDPFVATPAVSSPRPAQPKSQPTSTVTTPGNVPSSLKSHMASMTPDAGGNKAPETALPSIEPVTVPEFAERALLTEQPAIAYPPNAKTQQGTVVLQVLVGRDGTVQDAKFLQGSLAFARPAIDGVKQWKFKPYVMNGRPVSVQTLLTIAFKPAS